MPKVLPFLIGALVLLLAASGYLGYEWRTTLAALESAKAELASSTNSSAVALKNAAQDNEQLAEALAEQKRVNDSFLGKIEAISGTVGKLDKLSKTDPELLQKYSKVYFLNENYIPESLTLIPKEWTYGAQEEYFHGKLWPHLLEMMEDAKDDGVNLEVVSGYRSFGKQAQLKASYKVTYGAGANAFSADQGYSEHQLGSTVDFTTKELGANFTTLDTTEAYAWLTEHAHRYGFVLSYPKGNTYYQYEPWHWRYVGRELADDLDDEGKHFYDLEQRELDKYLINFYD
jgi:LAS superfamily LD-carboxypeptidase LdcB